MKKFEKYKIYEELAKMNDNELEKEYYKSVENCLGSEAEKMQECGYCNIDIKERLQYEKYLVEKSNILEDCCIKRKIKIWQ